MTLGDPLDMIHMDLSNIQLEGEVEEHIETEALVTTGIQGPLPRKHDCDVCKI